VSSAAATLPFREVLRRDDVAPWALTALLFVTLFWQPFASLVREWWVDPSASHALVLAPLAILLAWRRGLVPGARAQPVLGSIVLTMAVGLRFLGGLAAEVFTMRMSLLLAAAALVMFTLGVRQLRHWWLSGALLMLSIPLPAVLLGSVSLPLQFQASRFGAALLEARYVPVRLSGNVIDIPGQRLFVTEACSGLRSLTALLSLAVLLAGTTLKTPWVRAVLVAAAIPIAVFLNGLRIFLTGFLVYYVSPDLGRGFLHYSEGWLLFLAALSILASVAWALRRGEGRLLRQWPK